MKHLLLTILLLCAVNLTLSAQEVTYDPCGELRVAMLTADRLVVEGKLDEALTKLNKFKNDPEMQNCSEMKNGVLDYKIQEVKKKIAERDAPKPSQQMNTSSSSSLPSYKKCPDGNHPHLIDLGLPSGTKWACCNVDAKKPEDAGGYYAWGETSTKSDYSWSTYKHCDGTQETCKNLGSNICGTQYDVAHVKWGGSWQLPTDVQINELRDNCKNKKATVYGVNGRMFTSKKNGASIFLPAAGYRNGLSLNRRWNRRIRVIGHTDVVVRPRGAYEIYFVSGDECSDSTDRCFGHNVRPVSK